MAEPSLETMTKGEEEAEPRVNASEDGEGGDNGAATAAAENADRETAEQSKALGSLTSQVRERGAGERCAL